VNIHMYINSNNYLFGKKDATNCKPCEFFIPSQSEKKESKDV